jgi:hypothetical protein
MYHHHHHHFQPFTIHCWMEASSIFFHSRLSRAICIHSTPHILLNSSTHRPLGLPCFLSHPVGYHSSISRVHLPSILLAMYTLQLFRTFRYISHFGHASYPYVFLLRSLLVIPSIHASLYALDLA